MHVIKLIFLLTYTEFIHCNRISTKSVDELFYDYEDDKNSMIAIAETENPMAYEDFYEELDNWMAVENSMNILFYGPSLSFMRLDSESILHILMHTKKQYIPISRALLAWDLITDGKTAAFLQGREYLAFGSLLNVVPEEDLYYVNFGDPSVLKYFANTRTHLHERKYGILSASYKRYYGTSWYCNASFINDMGYLLCGFPVCDLKMISSRVFKEITLETLMKLYKCTSSQIMALYDIATEWNAYGNPYRWSSHEVSKLGLLFTYTPDSRISSISLEAIHAISPQVMKAMSQQKLSCFTRQQILRMNPKARRVYILRMELKSSLDMNQLVKKSAGLGVKNAQIFLGLILFESMVTLLLNLCFSKVI